MEKKNKNYLFFMAISILVVFTSGFIINSLFFDIKEASDKYLEEKEEIRELTVKNEKLKDENQQEIKEMITSLNELFINQERPVEEIIFLENTIEKNNLSGEVKVGETENSSSDYWSYLNLNVEIKGAENEIFSFLTDLEERKWLFSISQMNMKNLSNNNESENQDTEAEITLKAYFLSK